jgi:hypothetical protein
LLVADVDLNRVDLCAAFAQFRTITLKARFITVRHDHFGPLSSEGSGRFKAHSACGARNEDGSTGKAVI